MNPSSSTGPFDYRDYSRTPDVHMNCDFLMASLPKNFVRLLYRVLEEAECGGFEDIVSWQPHGRCFAVHKRDEFVEKVLPKYFSMSTYQSFQRQLNHYGFQRISRGPDKSGYYHEFFLRTKIHLLCMIGRHRLKGQGPRKPDIPPPDFYRMIYLPPMPIRCPPMLRQEKSVVQRHEDNTTPVAVGNNGHETYPNMDPIAHEQQVHASNNLYQEGTIATGNEFLGVFRGHDAMQWQSQAQAPATIPSAAEVPVAPVSEMEANVNSSMFTGDMFEYPNDATVLVSVPGDIPHEISVPDDICHEISFDDLEPRPLKEP